MTVLSTLCKINTLTSLINKPSIIKLLRADQNAFKQGNKIYCLQHLCFDLVIIAWAYLFLV